MSDSYIQISSEDVINAASNRLVEYEEEIAKLEAVVETYKNKTVKLFWLFEVSTYDSFDHVKESFRIADLKDICARLETLMRMGFKTDTIYLSARDYDLVYRRKL